MQLKVTKDNKKELELDAIKNEAEKESQKAKELCRSIKATVIKVNQITLFKVFLTIRAIYFCHNQFNSLLYVQYNF